MVGGIDGPCPKCGGTGTIPDGIYEAAGDVIRVLASSQKTIDQLQKIASTINRARNNLSEPENAVETIKREAPELSSIADVLPRTRNELILYLQIIFAAIQIVISAAALYMDRPPSEADIQRMINETFERAFPEHGETNKQKPYRAAPKPGRNDPCSCGSGKKYKKCCGRLI